MMTIGSLFSGIGGLELGLEQSGLGHTVWQVEQDSYCRAVLAHHWPHTERFEDVREVGAAQLVRVDLVCGGFPCQDVSSAGGRAGLAGARSGLWYEFARIVGELRPRWVVVENVASGAALWVDAVRGSLGELGYASLPVPCEAGWLGAPYERGRVFLVAHADSQSEPVGAQHAEVASARTHAGVDGDGLRNEQGGPAGRIGEERPSLQTIAKRMLPTLCARDSRGRAPARKRKGGKDLHNELGVTALCPRWCEWYQGFPDGHTLPMVSTISPARPDAASKRSATRSSRRRPRSSDTSSGNSSKEHGMDKWDSRFIELARLVSTWSKDATKVGCVIVAPDRAVLSMGYNGFPRGVSEDDASRHERPAKYRYTEHAERNAIYNAVRSGTRLIGGTIYLPWFPCADCARAVVQVGISRLVGHQPNVDDPKWGADFVAALAILQEGGVGLSLQEP